MEEKGKKVSKKTESKKSENVEKKAKPATAKSTGKKVTAKQTKKPVSQTVKTKQLKDTKSQTINKTKQEKKEIPQVTTVKLEKDKKPQETKTKQIKEEKTQATKVKQVKIDTKPINSGYTRVKTTKQIKKGKSGIVLLIALLIILAIVIINTYRNYSILTKLNNRFNLYATYDNYHKTAICEGDDIDITRMEVYKKGNIGKNIIYVTNKKIIQISSPTGGTKTFFDTPSGKEMIYANSNESFHLAINDTNYATENTLIRSLGMPISSEKVDGVDCYVLNAKNFVGALYQGEKTKSFKVCIEKETGLVKQINEKYVEKGEIKTRIIKYTNEFNNVKDSDLSAPNDIGEYVIKNK